jgi:hypothetical protein
MKKKKKEKEQKILVMKNHVNAKKHQKFKKKNCNDKRENAFYHQWYVFYDIYCIPYMQKIEYSQYFS